MLGLIRRLLDRLHEVKVARYMENLKSRGLQIGSETTLMEPFFLDPDHCFLIKIGDNCTMAPNVRFIAHDASTKHYLGYTRIGKITVHDKCFIGDSTIILPNVSIGPNSIIGSGSIVNKDVPPNVVAAGNPVRVICSLQEYLDRVAAHADLKGVYDHSYLIDSITEEKRAEVLEALADEQGYIV